MMKLSFKKFLFTFAILGYLTIAFISYAENPVSYDGVSLLPKSEMFISPRNGDFIVDSTFEVPIYINTKGNNINTVSLKIRFDPSKLSIVKPSGGKSIFGIWVEPPSYDNTKGTASLIGIIPDGIVTSSGQVATITFKAIGTGDANIAILDSSSANLGDGLGTSVKLILSGASYHIVPKSPEGVRVSSETHPFEDRWYNNNSPVFKWEAPSGAEGYSVVLDVNPGTIPNTSITTNDSSIAYENLKNGIWYLHVRAKANGVWGGVSHFQVKIDTNSPAKFDPEVDTLKDSSKSMKYFISFITTDSLSGISRYEVGIINKDSEETASPVFIETESPYIISNTNSQNIRVIVRAFDEAGNMRESYVDIYPGFTFVKILEKYSLFLLLLIILLLVLDITLHYIFGHHLINHIRRAFAFFKKISSLENKQTEEKLSKNILPELNEIQNLPQKTKEDNKNEENEGKIT